MRREGEGKGEQHQGERETSICLLQAPNQGPGPQPGMSPDQESNQWPFDLQTTAQPTEPHQWGLGSVFTDSIIVYNFEEIDAQRLYKDYIFQKMYHKLK